MQHLKFVSAACGLMLACALFAGNVQAHDCANCAHDGMKSEKTTAKTTAKTAKTYRNVRGQVAKVVKPQKSGGKTAVAVDHETIPNFMRAMRMTIPLKNAADAPKLKQGAKIRFDLSLQNGNFVMSNIVMLPPSTKLKLASM